MAFFLFQVFGEIVAKENAAAAKNPTNWARAAPSDILDCDMADMAEAWAKKYEERQSAKKTKKRKRSKAEENETEGVPPPPPNTLTAPTAE